MVAGENFLEKHQKSLARKTPEKNHRQTTKENIRKCRKLMEYVHHLVIGQSVITVTVRVRDRVRQA